MKYLIVFSLFCLSIFAISLGDETEIEAFSPQVIQHGAIGDDVIELQSRLQFLGFYNRKIDGVFGWSTYWALRNFQYEFGLPIDGLAGEQTKNKLTKASDYDENYVKQQINQGKKFTHYGGTSKQQQQTADEQPPASNTTAVNVPQGFSQNDIQLMANAVYGESRENLMKVKWQ